MSCSRPAARSSSASLRAPSRERGEALGERAHALAVLAARRMPTAEPVQQIVDLQDAFQHRLPSPCGGPSVQQKRRWGPGVGRKWRMLMQPRTRRPAGRSPSRRRACAARAPRSRSAETASVTVGRRAPTSTPSVSCVSDTGMRTAPGTTRPQRAASSVKSATMRSSTRGIVVIASCRDWLREHSSAWSRSARLSPGIRVATFMKPSSRTATSDVCSARQDSLASGVSWSTPSGRTTSSAPSSSSAWALPTTVSLAMRPSMTSIAHAPSSGRTECGSQGPGGTLCTCTPA